MTSPINYNDLAIVHKYLDEITIFIQAIVEKESAAIVLACQVFEAHKKRQDAQPFESEENRIVWLRQESQKVAKSHLKHIQQQTIKNQAIRAAIHDCP